MALFKRNKAEKDEALSNDYLKKVVKAVPEKPDYLETFDDFDFDSVDFDENHVFMESETKFGFSKGVIRLYYDRITFTSNKGKEEVFPLEEISELSQAMGCLSFKYGTTKKMDAAFTGLNITAWWGAIGALQRKDLKAADKDRDKELDEYIKDKLYAAGKIEAVKYYRSKVGMGYFPAKEHIDKLFEEAEAERKAKKKAKKEAEAAKAEAEAAEAEQAAETETTEAEPVAETAGSEQTAEVEQMKED